MAAEVLVDILTKVKNIAITGDVFPSKKFIGSVYADKQLANTL